ncbi:hypothetical protein AMTRI_Chr12g270040 [Amborella trichopoda]
MKSRTNSPLVMDQISSTILLGSSPSCSKTDGKRGLYYNCNEKFCSGHPERNYSSSRHAWRKFAETPEISLHAIAGISAPDIMQVKGSHGHVAVTVLVDSGSTHNFVSEKLARKVGLQPVLRYDVVLGAQWLCTLGPIVWHFSKLQMRFHKFCCNCSPWRHHNYSRSSSIPTQVQLLEKYKKVFTEPKGLPPQGVQDHKLPLLPGQGPICVKPYGYPHYQISEIGKLVAEMLSIGVIH